MMHCFLSGSAQLHHLALKVVLELMHWRLLGSMSLERRIGGDLAGSAAPDAYLQAVVQKTVLAHLVRTSSSGVALALTPLRLRVFYSYVVAVLSADYFLLTIGQSSHVHFPATLTRLVIFSGFHCLFQEQQQQSFSLFTFFVPLPLRVSLVQPQHVVLLLLLRDLSLYLSVSEGRQRLRVEQLVQDPLFLRRHWIHGHSLPHLYPTFVPSLQLDQV